MYECCWLRVDRFILLSQAFGVLSVFWNGFRREKARSITLLLYYFIGLLYDPMFNSAGEVVQWLG